MSMNRCSQCPGKADAKYLSEHNGFCPVCWTALTDRIDKKAFPNGLRFYPVRMVDYVKEQQEERKEFETMTEDLIPTQLVPFIRTAMVVKSKHRSEFVKNWCRITGRDFTGVGQNILKYLDQQETDNDS